MVAIQRRRKAFLRAVNDEVLDQLAALHARVDAAASALSAIHRERMVCRRGCIGCCADELTVFEVEAERIRRAAPELLASGAPHPPGRCAFLDSDGACRVYEVRPYVCRTQGLPLRWIDEEAAAEYRDICELNDEQGAPIETLDEGECWTIGPFESALASLERRWDGGAMRRVALRDLF
ncbi:MAG TPA: YkgJ family cysteine cluster protein [Thermoanaerobaculia bacterium]|nr:YkgJ family cysteine cluster protein [Thermoanaerobaculia bacterium]